MFQEIKHLILLKKPKYDGYQRGLASMVYKFFDKKTKGCGVTLANKSAIKSVPQNEQLVEELHKPITRKLKKGKYIQHSKTIFGLQI